MRLLSAASVFAAAALILSGCATATPNDTAGESSSPSASASSSPSAEASQTASPTVSESPKPEVSTSPKAPEVDAGLATTAATAKQLTYLIEEEKLAHDVYMAMFDLWGSRVFGNILSSEESHQSQVLTVMDARGIKDPRSSKTGVFQNDDLQQLYNELIAKGSKSAVDAYEVGVAIEELDIDDLSKMLATAKDSDVISMMENLRRGSENHLRAFNNQL